MKMIIYPKLCTRSKNAMKRLRSKWGTIYNYSPRLDLVRRLCYELGLDEEAIYEQIAKERDFLLKSQYGEFYEFYR